MLSFITLTVVLAAVASATPYPPQATVKPTFSGRQAYHSPNQKSHIAQFSANSSDSRLALGGYVRGPAARYDQGIYDGIGAGNDWYTMYWGDGGYGHGWPAKEQWVSFVDMFEINKEIMWQKCGWLGWGADNSGEEIGAIWDSIQQVAAETNIDHRFILAIMMQESGGCVRAPTTDNGYRNPGLMQCFMGDGTCNSDITHQVQNPCPSGVITQMIREGSAGTVHGHGLCDDINQSTEQYGPTDSRAFYMAARIYNSGDIGPGLNLEDGLTATPCYSSDIANRLTGWTMSEHRCYLDFDGR